MNHNTELFNPQNIFLECVFTLLAYLVILFNSYLFEKLLLRFILPQSRPFSWWKKLASQLLEYSSSTYKPHVQL